MINIQNTTAITHSPNGTIEQTLIPVAVQQNFSSIQQEFWRMEEQQRLMFAQLLDLEGLVKWVTKNHPNVVQEYVVTNATKEKLGVA